ncbi:hypothetical protein BKE38_04845 [Pseudoroseomonas deserti]|uniref:Uncharacterized protein n=1 Tax=Teichococcus deserti TaxID=1817963 RepID=A0A1V2H693_9PROT|nr:hypothetical protein [Pseudoroseomonas deserti]ONG57031.1 hypothetical protein BKE38_04845 [Pseudoroseomonas deserti]
MSDMDQLRMLKQSAEEARRQHISNTLGTEHPPASTERLPGLQRMLSKVGQALGETPREAARDGDPRGQT